MIFGNSCLRYTRTTVPAVPGYVPEHLRSPALKSSSTRSSSTSGAPPLLPNPFPQLRPPMSSLNESVHIPRPAELAAKVSRLLEGGFDDLAVVADFGELCTACTACTSCAACTVCTVCTVGAVRIYCLPGVSCDAVYSVYADACVSVPVFQDLCARFVSLCMCACGGAGLAANAPNQCFEIHTHTAPPLYKHVL